MKFFVALVLMSAMALEIHSAPPSSSKSTFRVSSDVPVRPLIVGGVEARRNEFPWLVRLTIKTDEGNYLCSGALIRLNTVLTAAHCVDGAQARNIDVTAGDHDRTVSEPTEQLIAGRSLRVHEDYDSDWFLGELNDIAVITLDGSFNQTTAVSTINLPARDARVNGTASTGTVAGWGTTVEDGAAARVLMKVDVPLVTDNTCSRQVRQIDGQFCAGATGKDSCQGDSGGPFMCHDLPDQVCGIVSYGEGCGRRGLPGVYTKVSHFIDWLNL